MAVDFGKKRVMDEGWALRAQQEIQNNNRKTYQDALNRAKQDYADADWLTKLTSGLTEGNYLKRHGFTDEMNDYGNQGLIGANDFYDYRNNLERQLTADMDKGNGAVDFLNDIPVIGGVLNYLTSPIAQLAGAANSIGTGEWDKRDHLSDAAALGQIGLAALTAGFGAPASLAAKMGVGAVTGAAENALDTIRQNGEKTNGGDLLGSAAIGGAFGAGIPLAGAGLGKIAQRGTRAIANNVAPALGDDAALAFAKQAGKGTQFGAGLRDLGGSAINRFNNMSKLGKAATVGGVAAGGFGLNNLLNGNNGAYGNNYYGGY
jgi:hypothetical protein